MQRRLQSKWGEPSSGQPAPVIDGQAFSTHLKNDLLPLVRECRESIPATTTGRLHVAFEILADPDIGGIVESVEFLETNEVADADMLECIRESALSITFASEATGRNQVRLSQRQ